LKASAIGRCVRLATVAAGVVAIVGMAATPATAQDISINLGPGGGNSGLTERVIQLIAFLTVLSQAPSILI